MTSVRYARPAIPILIAFVIGLASGAVFPAFGSWVWIAVAFLFVWIMYRIAHTQPAIVAPLFFCALSGYLAIQPWLAPDFPKNHIIHFTKAPIVRLSGVVSETPIHRRNRTKFILNAQHIDTADRSQSVTGNVRVTVYGEAPILAPGDAVSFSSRIKLIHNFNNPGGFDYQIYMAFQRVWVTASIAADKLHIFPSTAVAGRRWSIDRVRSRIAGLIDRIDSPRISSASRAVLKALLVGDRSDLTPEWRRVFNRSGVGHLLAISGLHIGIIAATSFWFLRRLFTYWQAALRRAWVVKMAAGLTLIPVVAYGLLAGMSPSTQRALIMVGVFLIAFVIEREQDLLNSLAVAGLIILVVNPSALFSVSFQLSFSAVAGILLGFSCYGDTVQGSQAGLGERVRHGLISMGLVSLLALLSTLPLVMYYFNLVSLVGWGVNFLMVPMVGFIVIPLGLLAVGTYPWLAPLALGLWKICLMMLSVMMVVLRYVANWPWAAVQTVTPSGIEIVCYYILLLGLFGLAKSRFKVATPQRARLTQWGKRAVVVVLIVAGCDVGYWVYQRFLRQDLRITALDVGQGSATLVEIPGGHTVLIDGGGYSDNAVFDIGARVVAPLLWRKKIKTVETLVLSHPNSDHLNGLLYIAENFNVREFWSNGEPADNAGYRHLIRILKQAGIVAPPYDQLPRQRIIHDVRFEILYPPVDFLQRRRSESWRSGNNSSLVLKVSYGRQSILIPGDIMARGEAELIAHKAAVLPATVLLAPHHGSRTSSSPDFLDQVCPQIVVISSGWENRFGFPHPSVMQRYQQRGCLIYRTDQQGAIGIVTDGAELHVEGLGNS